ncbi:hypothetical protein V8G54_004518 [Vigna mungo]|uniref:Uncharacterized protein n=1 Tax=Vigna mungo TaxID=3915 RepID=A0AAQ3SB70_VIGMU
MVSDSESEETSFLGSIYCIHVVAQSEKRLVPWKTSLGIPNLVAESVAHGKNISATTQLGRCFCNSCSSGSCSEEVARKKLSIKHGLVIESVFSRPSGKPTSAEEKLMVWIWIWLSVFAFPMALEIKGALPGVVIMVAFTPFSANNLAMSTVGII